MAGVGSFFGSIVGKIRGVDGGGAYSRSASDDVYLHEVPEDESEAALLKQKNFVLDHGSFNMAVDSERVRGPMGMGVEALATPPIEFTVKLSEEWKHGDVVKIQGPHGPIEVEPPAEAAPGKELRYRLAPRHEFRVEVPPELRPGQHAKFIRPDGVAIEVQVPPNLRPGDTFEVLPPALMVRVPDGVSAGDFVVFGRQIATGEGVKVLEWCRSQVPPGYKPGQYFAARLPLPDGVPKPPRNIPRAQNTPAPQDPEKPKVSEERDKALPL